MKKADIDEITTKIDAHGGFERRAHPSGHVLTRIHISIPAAVGYAC